MQNRRPFGDFAGAVEFENINRLRPNFVRTQTAELPASTHQKHKQKNLGCENSTFGGVVICLARIRPSSKAMV